MAKIHGSGKIPLIHNSKNDKPGKLQFKQKKVDIAANITPTIKDVGTKIEKDNPINTRKVTVKKKTRVKMVA